MKKILVLLLTLFTASIACADNFNATQGSGSVLATDEISSTHYPRYKPCTGIDGVCTDVSGVAPMPTGDDCYSYPELNGVSSSDITNTTAASVAAAGGSGYYHYIKDLTVANSHASVGTNVELLCGSTVKHICPAGAVYGGCVKSFSKAIKCGNNEAINCKNQTTGAAVRCSVGGCTKPF